MKPEFEVYADVGMGRGICTSLPLVEAKKRMSPAWVCRERSGFHPEIGADGVARQSPQGSPCPDAPKTHRHYLFGLNLPQVSGSDRPEYHEPEP